MLFRKGTFSSLEVSNDSASVQWRIPAPVVESACVLSQRFLLQKHRGQKGRVNKLLVRFPVKDG